jgi:hypothetical protein
MYVENPAPLLEQLADAAAPGGLISVLTKNATAAPLRPALQGQWDKALLALDAPPPTGNLGVVSRFHRIEDITGPLTGAGAALEAWYGVRVATDHIGDTPTGDPDELAAITNLEWELGRRDPYRSSARLIHVLCRRPHA